MPTREQVAEVLARRIFADAACDDDRELADQIIALFPSFTAEDAALLRRAEGLTFYDDVRLRAMADVIDRGVR